MTSVSTLAEAVDRLSPFAGKSREMHRQVARWASETGLVTISTPELAAAVSATKMTAQRWLWQKAVPEGWLEVVVDRRKMHRPSTFRVADPQRVIEG